MTVVQEREADASAASIRTATEIEVLFKEARQRARRRRIFTAVVVITSLAVVGLGAGFGATLFAPPKASTSGAPGQPLAGSASSFPSTYLQYRDLGFSSSAGQGIFLMSTKTGLPIRKVVPGNNFYVGYGFALTPDGKTLYYDEESSRDGSLQILSVPVAGGAPKVVGVGTTPLVSPDGRTLAFRPNGRTILNNQFDSKAEIALLDVATGATRLISIPGLKSGQPLQLSWVNSSEIYVVSSDLALGNCFDPKVVCPAKYPGWTALAQVVDITTGHWTKVVLPDAQQYVVEPDFGGPGLISHGFGGYGSTGNPRPLLPNITLGGPSTTPSSVRVVDSSVIGGGSAHVGAIGTMNVDTGIVTWTGAVPTGFGTVVATISGDSYLLSRASDGQLMKWSPRSGQAPSTVGPAGNAKYLGTQMAW